MTGRAATPLWVIEGFYGPPWPMAARLENYRLLGQWGYTGVIYAPKADRSLRSEWGRPFSADERAQLSLMAETAARSGLAFGVGLSPMTIWNDWSPDSRARLRAKLSDLHAAGCRALSLQFDDMRGAMPGLGALQAEIVAFVQDHWHGERMIVCPTYYSDDPILASVFGQPPPDYLRDFCHRLAPEIDVFWSGPKVASGAIDPGHIRDVTQRMGRPPFLWDNYPVNDGAQASRHLFLKPTAARDALGHGLLAGYAANPMLQPHLSQIPLRALADGVLHGSGLSDEEQFERAVHACVDPSAAPAIIRHAGDFATRGLGGMGPDETARRAEQFRQMRGPHAVEVADWLAGKYPFDPACLTD